MMPIGHMVMILCAVCFNFSIYGMKRAQSYGLNDGPCLKRIHLGVDESVSQGMMRVRIFDAFCYKMKLTQSILPDQIEHLRDSFVNKHIIPNNLLGTLLQQYHVAWHNGVIESKFFGGPEIYMVNGEIIFK